MVGGHIRHPWVWPKMTISGQFRPGFFISESSYIGFYPKTWSWNTKIISFSLALLRSALRGRIRHPWTFSENRNNSVVDLTFLSDRLGFIGFYPQTNFWWGFKAFPPLPTLWTDSEDVSIPTWCLPRIWFGTHKATCFYWKHRCIGSINAILG